MSPSNDSGRPYISITADAHGGASVEAYREYLDTEYRDAFDAKPGLVDDTQKPHRYNAACAAVLAGCGRGKNAAKLDATKRAELRKQALDWLRADLAKWAERLRIRKDYKRVLATLRHWQQDKGLAGVRDKAGLQKLDAEERALWQAFWRDVEALRKKAEEKKKN